MITVCTPLEPRTIAKIADSAMALSRKKPCFFVKIGTRSLGQCWITTHIAATRMIARSAPSPSSPAPSARRYAALGLDRSARPSKGDTMPQMRAGRCSPVLKIHARQTTSDRSSAGFLSIDDPLLVWEAGNDQPIAAVCDGGFLYDRCR